MTLARVGWPLLVLALAACDGQQSALSGYGPVASSIVILSWIMFAGAAIITLLICTLIGIAIFGPDRWRSVLSRQKVVVWGGIAFPMVTLSVLLVYGFRLMSYGGSFAEAENPVRIAVVGERWWWRVYYRHEDGSVTESANELRIPVGRVIEVELTSADVIHSFWLPAYAGKVDMIPGRTNILHFVADRPGTVRGQCAEYCGGAHTHMAFHAVAMEPEEYERWLAQERSPATVGSKGQELFLASGCGGCHTVRGTEAQGVIGPDLTHVASRLTLGAGVLPTTPENLAKWVAEHQQLKPENLMPAYEMLKEEEVRLLADYMSSLE